ncbi:hypothetical protein [Streptomyces sp. 3214.6]|nr:hypothetical protein [Streptomyces sp. 3214.6]
MRLDLDEIAAILTDPQANALEHLRARQRRLGEETGEETDRGTPHL